jgi:hypothetical protein
MVFEATAEPAAGGGKISLLNLRRYLKTLLDRSLLLGHVDRPSVHDVVRDFMTQQHSEAELRQRHRAVVDAFRARRPAGGRGWELLRTDSAACCAAPPSPPPPLPPRSRLCGHPGPHCQMMR